MKYLINILLLNMTIYLMACTFQHNKGASRETGLSNVCEPISFERVQSEIFGTSQSSTGKCLACHVAGGPLLALDTYGAVKARLAQIEDSVRSGRMPKNAVLPGVTKEILYAWIQQGAPEVATAQPGATDCATNVPPDASDPVVGPPTPALIEPHYESLRKAIFASQCLDCHDSSGIFSSYDFSTYESLASYQKLFSIPADGSDSRFVNSLVTGRMPRGKKPLPPEQIEIIRQWVALGLPETANSIGNNLGADTIDDDDDANDDDDDDGNTSVGNPPLPLPPVAAPAPPSAGCSLVDFQTVNTLVFQSSCTRCHDSTSDVNLESYSKIKQHLSAVQLMIQTDKMPPRKPLSPELKNLVLQWIDQGAPENVVVPETCKPKGEKP